MPLVVASQSNSAAVTDCTSSSAEMFASYASTHANENAFKPFGCAVKTEKNAVKALAARVRFNNNSGSFVGLKLHSKANCGSIVRLVVVVVVAVGTASPSSSETSGKSFFLPSGPSTISFASKLNLAFVRINRIPGVICLTSFTFAFGFLPLELSHFEYFLGSSFGSLAFSTRLCSNSMRFNVIPFSSRFVCVILMYPKIPLSSLSFSGSTKNASVFFEARPM
mmetsp:Transcript_2024/g.7222  ORF Transcript_2024/g.7222 Transcript_2024/m.7222 type:complete len:223 (-) Transcript_2024:651-1319(-)